MFVERPGVCVLASAMDDFFNKTCACVGVNKLRGYTVFITKRG